MKLPLMTAVTGAGPTETRSPTREYDLKERDGMPKVGGTVASRMAILPACSKLVAQALLHSEAPSFPGTFRVSAVV